MSMIIGNTLAFGLPLFIIAIGGIFSERSGITNLALEGFMGFGAFTGALAAVLVMKSTGMDSASALWIAMLAAAAGGALFSCLHAVLCIFMNADMVISGVVMNILSTSLTAFAVRTINEKAFKMSAIGKFQIGIAGQSTLFGAVEIYHFEILIVVAAVVMHLLLYKTRFGLRLRACGEFPQAVDSAGINVSRTRFLAVVISGALSGIGGLCFAYYLMAQFDANLFYVGYGYLAIAGLIFGSWKILPTLGACMLFSFVKAMAMFVASLKGVHISSTVNATLFAALPYLITLLALVFFSKHNKAPKALGESYDKGKR